MGRSALLIRRAAYEVYVSGQYNNTADFGLMYYRARWYDPSLGRFAQADTDVPESQGVQAWDRYAYVRNSPTGAVDPSGHDSQCTLMLDDQYQCSHSKGRRTINIPAPTYYACTPKDGYICITPDTSPQLAIALTTYGEGGGFGLNFAANITQTLHNRAQMAWTCHANPGCKNEEWNAINPNDIPWNNITPEQFTRLILYLISQPYIGDDGQQYPVYNAWAEPHELAKIEWMYPETWSAHQDGVANWLDGGAGIDFAQVSINFDGVQPDRPIRNINVMYFYSTYERYDPLRVDFVHKDDAMVGGRIRYQYYFTHPYP